MLQASSEASQLSYRRAHALRPGNAVDLQSV
jgi:hypothetical protein